MHMSSHKMLCLVIAFGSITTWAQDDAESVLDRADRLVSLRDHIVAEYGSWSADYAKEDTAFAKQQKTNCEQFAKRVNVKSLSVVSRQSQQGVNLRFIDMSGVASSAPKSENTKTILDISSGQLHPGPNLRALMKEASESGTSIVSLLARDVRKSGDLALLENSFLIPSGRYAKLGDANLQYYSGVDLSLRVKDHDPTCAVRKGEVVVLETTQKKYALVQYVGKHQEQVLLCIAYQPDGSAVFEFGTLPKPKELDYTQTDINPQDMAAAMFVHNRETFFWKEVQKLTGTLKNSDKDTRFTEPQLQRAKQLGAKLGITE